MRAAHAVEPTLSWPSDSHRTSARQRPVEVGKPGWSSRNVEPAAQPLARVAALLVSIAQTNTYEGRDPTVVPDALTSGFVADLLGVEIGTLAALLVDLRRRGLIDNDPAGLRLKDIEGLERLIS